MLKSTKRIIVAGLMSCAALATFGNGMANASCIGGSWGPNVGYPGGMMSSYGMGMGMGMGTGMMGMGMMGMGGPNYYGSYQGSYSNLYGGGGLCNYGGTNLMAGVDSWC
ncbi:hypothetical protein [Pasteuria penetrans]|uniref:hypothetical protein n=1 Tax=Pasteuria penetrans TaxID=86005 RepID=UPI000FB2BEEF|nr:hypothetical protein [Pasteuria penetrans]